MSTILEFGAFLFRCYSRESPLEPPHIHVIVDHNRQARINLVTDAWMDQPPPRAAQAMRLYLQHKAESVAKWNQLHATRKLEAK